MAFAKQYFSSYKSNNNLDYYLEIWVDGFDSSATEISIGAGGPVISYETDQEDRFSPILSSQCELPFVVKDTSLQAFIQLLRTTYQERQVYLHLYRATSSTYTTTKPIWSGFLVMDLGSGIDVSFPYEQKLTFVDGLSLLKDIDFVDLSNAGSETNIQGSYTQDNMYYGPAIYTFWIKEILAKAGCATTSQGVSIDYGFTTAVNWYNADMQNTNQGSDPLGLTQCVVSMFHNKNDQDVFTPENCYTVLKELLRHWGARITYWKHEFWIVQIPEYIQDESGLIDNPDNINSRQYNRFGTLLGSQDHLGDTYYTRYEQTIQSNQVSKLVGTKYNYLPMIHNAEADFLSFASKNYYGGFPYGVSAESQEIFQGTIIDPSTANFLWLSVPLNWTWDMTGSSLTAGHEGGWWCSVRFNFYASDGTTTYYLQYDSSGQGSYYWVLEADWTPLGNTSPKYIIKSRNLTETNYIGFQESIPFVDSSGSAITMTGAWSFFLDIEDFANQSSSGNNGSFYCRFSGYAQSSFYDYVKKDPYQEFPYLPTTGDVSGGGPQTKSGTVRWSNTLENPSGITTTSFSTPAGFDAGTSQADIQLITTSPFKGLLQTLNTTQSSSFGLSLNTQVNNSTNTETFSFGTLLWGDAIQQFAVGCLRVNNGTAFVKTNPDGEWGRGTLTGDNTFTELLIDEFLSGQIKVVIAPTMRLAVGEENKNQTATGTSGPATRPRYVNPIGRLREFRSNETDPEYIFRRGSFHSLYDEWDYEGYQILRDTVSSTTTTTDIGDLGGTQDNKPLSNAKIIPNVTDALMLNSPVASIRTTVPATGSNVAVNGNFNTAVGWTLGTGWSIDTTAKKAKFAATGSTSELTQSVLTQGLTYQVNFQVVVTAGTLLVKAGTSGTSLSITTSGDYSFYLDCDGSNLIKFQAGTTFTGNITYITLRDQKSISAVPINSIGSTVFKSGDTFNLINSLGGEILPLTVSSNQGATDDTISVTSTALFDDIGIDSVLLINQDDLSAQYQNKTKGTVAGFGIDADGISKGGIEITGWLNSDTMSGAAVTNVPTALSVKNYVDAQVGSADTLQEVTDNGNTTTNSVMIGSSSSPSHKLNVSSSNDSTAVGIDIGFNASFDFAANSTSGYSTLFYMDDVGLDIGHDSTARAINFKTGGLDRVTITGGGNLLIGTTTDSGEKLQVLGNIKLCTSNASYYLSIENNLSYANPFNLIGAFGVELLTLNSGQISTATNVGAKFGVGTKSPTEKLHVVGDALITGDSHADAFKPAVAANPIKFKNFGSTELARITDGGNLLIGMTDNTGDGKLKVFGDITIKNANGSNPTEAGSLFFNEAGNTWGTNMFGFRINLNGSSNNLQIQSHDTNSEKTIISIQRDTQFVTFSRGASFGDQVTIPATPVASTDAASKSYVDAQVGLADTLQEVTDNGNATSNSIKITGGATEGGNSVQLVYNANYAQLQLKGSTGSFVNFSDGSTDFKGRIKYMNSDNSMQFITNTSEKMRLTSGGNLVVGTTTDVGGSRKIQVAGGDFYTAEKSNTAGANAGYGGSSFQIRNGSTSEDLNFDLFNRTSFNWYTPFVIKNTGNVGIGTTSPAQLLHVFGGAATIEIDSTTNESVLNFDNSTTTANIKLANNDLKTELGGSEKMRILANGNVLIGTTTDSGDKLQVNGSLTGTTAKLTEIELGDNQPIYLGAGAVMKIFNDGANSIIRSQGEPLNIDANGINFRGYSPYNNLMKINSNGNVLIGTTTDSGYKLTVAGDISLTNNNTSLLGKTTGGSNLAIFKLDSSNNFQYGSIYAGASSIMYTATDFVWYTYPSSVLSQKMTLKQNGNLLIGTTTDSGYKLNVNGNIQILDTDASDGSVFGYLNFTSTTGGSSGNHARISAIRDSNSAGQMLFSTKSGGSVFERLRITSGGNVLIGTTTASGEKLEVNGTAKITGTAKIIGNVSVGGSPGAVYKLDVVGKQRVQSVLELEDVLTLNAISTPADPASGKSSIYMDSADGAIKVKINVGGTVVTRTIASFE